MFSELERCGILVRGRPLSDEELAEMLRVRGYDVQGTAARREDEQDR